MKLKTDPTLSKAKEQKTIIPPGIDYTWIRFEVLLGVKLSGHTDTLTETLYFIDDLKKVKYKTNNNIEMLLRKLILFKKKYLVSFYNK